MSDISLSGRTSGKADPRDHMSSLSRFSRGFSALAFLSVFACLFLPGCKSNRFGDVGRKDNDSPAVSIDFKPGADPRSPDEPVDSTPALRSNVSFDESWKRAANFSRAEGIVQEAYKIKEVNQGYEFMRKGKYQEALDSFRRAQARLGSNPFVAARMKHAELLTQQVDADKNRALAGALEIVDEEGRAAEARNLAEEALSLHPNNLFVRKEANRVIYETSLGSNSAKAREAKVKMVNAARLIQDIRTRSDGFLFNYSEER